MTALESAIRVSLGRPEYAPTRQMAATDVEPMNIIYAAHRRLRLLDEERMVTDKFAALVDNWRSRKSTAIDPVECADELAAAIGAP